MSNLINNLSINPSNIFHWISEACKKETFQKALFLTGVTIASWSLIKHTSRIVSYIFTHELNLLARYGVDSWALITGATEGVGKEFALQLAQRGFNLVLVARKEDKLSLLRSEITTRHPNVSVRIVLADFCKSAEEGFYENILQQVSDLDISLLVNNVGQYIVEEYHLMPTSEIRDMVVVNCLSQALMTRSFLPKLLARSNNKVKSGIINMSSITAVNSTPYSQLYGSTKVFIDYLSQGLAYEYPNLDIISLKPAFIKTRLSDYNGKMDEALPTHKFVSSGLKYLGHAKESYGHWEHQLMASGAELLPKFILDAQLKLIESNSLRHAKAAQKQGQIISEKL